MSNKHIAGSPLVVLVLVFQLLQSGCATTHWEKAWINPEPLHNTEEFFKEDASSCANSSESNQNTTDATFRACMGLRYWRLVAVQINDKEVIKACMKDVMDKYPTTPEEAAETVCEKQVE